MGQLQIMQDAEIALSEKSLDLLSISNETVNEYFLAQTSPGTRNPSSEMIDCRRNEIQALSNIPEDIREEAIFAGAVEPLADIIQEHFGEREESKTPVKKEVKNEIESSVFNEPCSTPLVGDWNIKFDTPKGQNGTPSKFIAKTPVNSSLLDVNNEFTTPNSILKYSERDVLDIKKELYENFQKESEFMNMELQSLNSKYESCLCGKQQLESMLNEYEKTMATMIGIITITLDEARKQKENSSVKENEDNLNLKAELKILEQSYRELNERHSDLRILYEAAKKNEHLLQDNVSSLKQDVSTSERRYEALKLHAEEKLESAKREVEKVKMNYENESSLLRAKLSKCELRIKTLESSVESKTQENAELMVICDELIQKMDNLQNAKQ